MPRGGQYTSAFVEGDVRLSNGRRDKLEEVVAHLLAKQGKRLAISNPRYSEGPNHRCSVVVHVRYGRVVGGWASDVRRLLHEACAQVGTRAEIGDDHLKRVEVECVRPSRGCSALDHPHPVQTR